MKYLISDYKSAPFFKGLIWYFFITCNRYKSLVQGDLLVITFLKGDNNCLMTVM